MSFKHIIRTKDGDTEAVGITPIRAIRFFCKECMGYAVSEVPKCTDTHCPLFLYRMGKRPTDN